LAKEKAERVKTVLLLQESVLGGEAVQGVIDLADGADESGEGVCLEVAGVDPVGIDLTDVDLHRGVVLGGDDAAGRGASNFERKKIERIKIHGVPSIHYEGKRGASHHFLGMYRSTFFPSTFSIMSGSAKIIKQFQSRSQSKSNLQSYGRVL